jgi:hypothetical protein
MESQGIIVKVRCLGIFSFLFNLVHLAYVWTIFALSLKKDALSQ